LEGIIYSIILVMFEQGGNSWGQSVCGGRSSLSKLFSFHSYTSANISLLLTTRDL